MAKVKVEVFVEPVTADLMTKLSDFVFQIRKAMADGWQPGKDLPVVLSALMVDLLPVIQNFDKALLEAGDDKEAFVTTIQLGAQSLVFGLLKPVAVPV